MSVFDKINFLPIMNFVWAAVIVIGGIIAIKIILRITKKSLEKGTLDPALHKFVVNALKIVLWIVLAVSVLGYLGLPTSTFVAVLGAAGAAVALALKDSLGNIAGGLLIIINKPFKRGDFIDISGTSGVVDSIDLLVTILKTIDNKVITIPNGTMTTSILTNYSKEEIRRVDCVFGIGYEAGIGAAKDAIYAVIEANPDILTEPAPLVAVASHGDSAVNLDCKVWCKNPQWFDIKYYLEENVKLAFDEAGINIPYPQVDVHVKK